MNATIQHAREQFEALRQALHRGGKMAHYVVDSAECTPEGRPFQEAIWFHCNKPATIPSGKRKVYYTVNPCYQIPPTNARGRKVNQKYIHSQNEYVACLNALYAEFDNKDFGEDDAATMDHINNLSERGVPASSSVTHSGGGFQCHWLLDETFMLDSDEARARAARVQKAWVELVSGDPGAHDLRRILRVPGTWNVKEKYGPDGKLCHFVKLDLSIRYTFEELEALLPEPEPEPDREQLAAASERLANVKYGHDLLSRYIDDELDLAYQRMTRQLKGGRSAAIVEEAMKLSGIAKADWSNNLLPESEIYSTLLQAADQNGLIRDYGRAEIEREIGNGLRLGDARLKPNLARRYPELVKEEPRSSAFADRFKAEAATQSEQVTQQRARAVDAASALIEESVELARYRKFVKEVRLIVAAPSDEGWDPATKIALLYTQLELFERGEGTSINRGASGVAEAVSMSPATASSKLRKLQGAGVIHWGTERDQYDHNGRRAGPDVDPHQEGLHWQTTSIVMPCPLPSQLPALTATAYEEKQQDKARENRARIKQAVAILEKASCPTCEAEGKLCVVCGECGEKFDRAHDALRGVPDVAEAGHFEVQNHPAPDAAFEVQNEGYPAASVPAHFEVQKREDVLNNNVPLVGTPKIKSASPNGNGIPASYGADGINYGAHLSGMPMARDLVGPPPLEPIPPDDYQPDMMRVSR